MTGDRSYAEARRLVWCATCCTDVEDGRILVDHYGGIVTTFCDRPTCRRDAYADVRTAYGSAAGFREVSP
jgi:hypothetical protein